MTDGRSSQDLVASGADDASAGPGTGTSAPRGDVDGQGAPAEGPGADTGGQGGDADRSVDEGLLFHLLRSERRRLALRYLLATDGTPVGMRDLAEAVAAAEHGTTVEALDYEARQRAYVPLSQSHLPQLDRAGVVEYDQTRGVVAATPRVAAFEPYLYPGAGAGEEDGGVRLAPVATGAGVGGLLSLALVWMLGPIGGVLAGLLAVAALFGVGLTRWR